MNTPIAARDLIKSNTSAGRFSWLLITTTAGSVVLDTEGGNVVTLAAVPVGVWIPVGTAFRVKTASTAVGFMVA